MPRKVNVFFWWKKLHELASNLDAGNWRKFLVQVFQRVSWTSGVNYCYLALGLFCQNHVISFVRREFNEQNIALDGASVV